MTFKERLEREHPEDVSEEYIGGCYGCPCDFGYEGYHSYGAEGTYDDEVCRACWDREMPMTPEELEAHDLAINAEIIRSYCGRFMCGECPARDPCRDEPGMWSDGCTNTSAEKQRAMLDAFGAALPPLDEEDDGRQVAAPTGDAHTIRLPDSVTVRIGPESDPVNHPSHYTAGGIECIDAIAAALTCQRDPMEAWLTGQVLKYLWRWPLKNGVEDLKKARWYLERLIGKVES